MARRTIDLLPEIFRTDTNRKFLSATLDQLTQEPSVKKTKGYVGRRVGPGVNPADNYVTEPTVSRADYQLEPGVVFLKPDTTTAEDAITYPGIIDALNLQGAQTTLEDRLFQSQYYAWDGFCDLDKFTNYSQYYWLPLGPDSVDVATTVVPTSDSFDVTRNANSYSFSDIVGDDPIITLVRGGNYTFNVNQLGHQFWIQTAPGVDGRIPSTPNISSRDVLGVDNNGEDLGTVTFNVPLRNAQDFYYNLTDIGSVDLITDLEFNQINNVYVDTFLDQYPTGIDGITSLNGRTLIFTTQSSEGWEITTQFDPLPQEAAENGLIGSYDSITFDQTTYITNQADRYSVWQIQYQYDTAGQAYIQLSPILSVNNLSRFYIAFGAQYSNTQWYKNALGYFEQMPLLTATLDTLYYQDSTNPNIFGQIKLIEPNEVAPIDLNEIVGAKNYTAPNGVVFTNGLKIQLRGVSIPAQYQNLEFYVEGVGTGPGIDARVGFIDGEAYFGPFHTVSGQKITGAVADNTVFQTYIYDTIEESLANPSAGTPADAPLPNTAVNFALVENGIKLLPVTDFVTPEPYTRSTTVPYDTTPYDVGNYDETLNAPEVPDYLTINRASRDRNAWSRSNRWFHIDVIRATATYNNSTPVLDNNYRGKRPIIEFRPNITLFNSGTQAKQPVNIIDFEETDALSNINGQIGYSTQGYTFADGSLVIFAADLDPNVRNRIYRVTFIDPDGNPNSTPVINLEPVDNGEALINQTVVSLSGVTSQGVTYWFNGDTWIEAQQKENVNQAPLFDVYDIQGRSFGNSEAYPSTNFAGSRLFGYALGGTQTTDEILGFSLKYLNINNVGDIVFENYLYTDTFNYVEGTIGQTKSVSDGFVRQYVDRVSFADLIGWQTAAAENRSRQVFRFTAAGVPLVLDIPVASNTVYAPVQIFIEGVFVDPDQYTVTTTSLNSTITFAEYPVDGTIIEVQVISDVASQVAFYQVPLNLENNPLNVNSPNFTLGTIRTHYESVCQNLQNLQGPINGANNTRDLGNIIPYGDNIVQHSAPLVLTGTFLRERQYELFNALQFNSQEYEKYKARLLNLVAQGDFINSTATNVLDSVMQEISLGRSQLSPFYWSDMIPAGETYTETTYTYSVISTPTFDTLQTYNFDSANYLGLLVYLNGTLLTLNYDYTVSADSPTLTITVPLTVGDVIAIREYSTTYGSYVPNTPTKVGLYPAYKPEIYLDESYVTPTLVIRGHDGSITRAFGDVRDDVLLEFETRIFNNLKVDSSIPLTQDEVVPGQFRTTEYTLAEINQILSTDFLGWVGWNKLDYTQQTYIATNEFTYNYSQSGDRLTKQPLLGNWRGIYNYFYDTDTPNTTPWEMLGFSQQPDWWENYYGPAPYTSGNLVLWEDLSAGLVRDPAGEYVIPRYVRPGLLQVIPSDSEGALISPLKAVVGNYDATSFRRSWTFGDNGPVEASWRNSSSYPFAVMRLLALTRPAEFFSLFVDRDLYKYYPNLNQYLWDGRYRLDAKNITPIYGNGHSMASYIDWIVDYNQQLGTDSTTTLTTKLANLDVRLCWRLAAYSDKKYLKIFTERSTPQSLNTSLLLPDESYQLMLYKNQAFEQFSFSSVIIQSTDNGWQVLGYSATEPYFNILTSRPNGLTKLIEAGGAEVRVPIEYSNNVARVPYGYVFTSRTAVCDFLISYGKLLEEQGWAFEGTENGLIMDWTQMATEFLYWSTQGWVTGSLINLNPGATRISITRPGAVAESIMPMTLDNIVLNQNRQPLTAADLLIDRLENTFRISTLTANTINYLSLRFTNYEHIVVLDNTSIFSDLIYQPATGARQSRIMVSGTLSAEWNGTLNAPGFVLNQDNIQEWKANRKYTKGEIVLFKNEYWTASTIINPSQEFNYSLWVKSDYNEIQKGLLPNAANSSDQLQNAYSVYSANLEQEVDLFSYGLIGFRPREYMQALNLDDVSQVQLYQQFLGSKGTRRSAEIFSYADLGKETAQYDIYEYWAMLRSQYGANANRSYFELLLNQALLTSNPSLIQVIQPGEESNADQTVLLENVWKESYKLTSTNILPTTTQLPTDTGLPSAGYVNLEDADITLFSLNDLATLDANIAKIGVGTIIWVAKSNAYDWNIYRAERVPGDIIEVADNLDGISLVTFNKQHGLVEGDYLIIRYFDTAINGAYRVRSVPSLTTVLIDFIFTGNETVKTGTGVGFTLQTTRVNQPSDIVSLPYASILTPGAKAWVDNNGQGLWTVLEKQDVYSFQPNLEPQTPEANNQFGAAVSQGFQNLTALVGAPGYNPLSLSDAPGAVYAFVKVDTNQYEENSVLTVDATDIAGYGNAIDIGDQSWAIVGASKSNNNKGYAITIYRPEGSDAFEQRQLFVAPDEDFTADSEFAKSVAMSLDERWMYVGAPGIDKVYAYGRVDEQFQTVQYTTDGSTFSYNWSDSIVLTSPASSHPGQLSVVLSNTVLTYPTDWDLVGNNVVLTSVPTTGQNLRISRRSIVQLDQTLYTGVEPTATSGSGTGATFTVNNIRGSYNVVIEDGGEDYAVGDTITIAGTDIGGATPANDLVLTITQTGATYTASLVAGLTSINVNTTVGLAIGQTLTVLDGSGAFGVGATITGINSLTSIEVSVANATSGFVQFYADPGAVSQFTQAGSGIGNTDTFTLSDVLTTATNIFAFTITVDGTLYRPFIDYTFDDLTTDLTFVTVPTAGASIIASAQSYFKHIGTITAPTSSTEFGYSIATTTDGRQVIVGAPAAVSEEGRVYVYDRSVERLQVTDASQTTYTTVRTITGVPSVSVNGEFLVNTVFNIGGTFTVTGSNTVEITAPLSVGDIIEISTNQFTLMDEVESSNPFETGRFGEAVDQCINNCSLYIAAPYQGDIAPEAGQVEFYQNRAKVYGSVPSTIANPTLTAGNYIRVNGYFVELTAAPAWSSSTAYLVGDFVSSSGSIFVAIDDVPAGTVITDTTYWAPAAWTDLLASQINDASVPNAIATTVANVNITGDGQTKTFNIGSIYSSAVSYTPVVYVNNVLQTLNVNYTYDNDEETVTFSSAPVNTDVVLVLAGQLTIQVKNYNSAQPANRLQVLPGTGTLFADLGIDLYDHQQVITSPVTQAYAHFGKSLVISDTSTTLVVGAPDGSLIQPCTFDNNTTTFDALSTAFADTTVQSGVVYIYDYLPAVNPSTVNPGQFVFGQQIYNNSVQALDQFGAAVDLTTGTLMAGSPGYDRGDSQLNYGQVLQFVNENRTPAWTTLRLQQPVVDINLLNTVFMYDRVSGAPKQYFDYFDPLQGRLLGVVRQNLDFIGAVDPAQYNVGSLNNTGNRWAEEHVGQIWWNTANARFIDPNQDDITYASRRWGQLFPGSTINVYQWVSSPVPPSQYTGPGIPLSRTNYVVSSTVNEQGIFSDVYYFWASDIRVVNRDAKKTLSIETIKQYIESPRSSGISYIAPINSSTIAIYNGLEYISAQDTIIHVEYDRQYTDAAVNVEYQLIPQDRADGFLVDSLYRKLLDSFSGADTAGNAVPDPLLPPSEKYGVQFRPRQSLFANRFLALENYLVRANEILAQFPISESRSSQLLNSAEPEPAESSGEWNTRVANYEELSYQDLNAVDLGYKYLVVSDSTNNGLWTIYEVQSGILPGSRELGLIRVQNYDTRLYWERIDWYRTNFDPLTRVLVEVPNYSALDTITVPEGSVVKVTANAQNKWELYILENSAWVRVGLQDGTIRFKQELWDYSVGRFGFDVEVFDAQYFDQSPTIETRNIIRAINEELLVGDLLIERNRQLVLMFNFILSEQIAPTWLTKTSLIDVDHVIRELVPYQIYRQDNQDFVLNYIQEVKPYHVQIREFNLIYQGSDTYQGTLTDFDLPAYWDADQNLFISPVLDDTGNLSTTSSVPSTSALWETFPYNQWYQNYLLGIDSVTVTSGGAGYLVTPEVIVTGDCVRQATMVAEINGAGEVVGITVVDPGEGYSTTATLTITGGGLPDADAWAKNLVVTAGDNIITDANNVYRVQTDGVLGDIPPTATSGTSVNGSVTLLYLGTVARAVASMGNNLVRSISTTIKFDRYQYSADFVEWQANVVYNQGDQVRYNARVWSANADNTTGTVFDPMDWTVVPAGDLSGVNRTMGYYDPAPNEPGLDLAQLIGGVDYPGVQVAAPGFDRNTGFDVGNYDINPFDNISYGPEGQPTYDPAILDAIYASEFTDPYLGTLPAPAYAGNPPTTGPNPIIVDGGEFVDTYSSHAPEELVPGAIFDTLDMRVFTTPGADWEGNGHGFPLSSRRYVYNSASPTYSFDGLLDYPAFVAVYDVTNGNALIQDDQYTVDWVDYTITITGGITNGDTIAVYVAAVGGGNQLYSNTYVGSDIGNTILVPVQYSLLYQFAIFVNGVQTTSYVAGAEGFDTRITFSTTYTSTDRITLTALGTNPLGTTNSWSLPTVQNVVSDGSLNVTLTNSLQGTNPIELVVSVNGVRARPYEGARYISDGTTTTYELPTRGGYSQALIANNDVSVYVNNSALTLGVDFVVDPYDISSNRTITLTTAPTANDVILIAVRTAAQYFVVGDLLTFRPSAGLTPSAGEIISIMTWNDTAEQGIFTQVFVGPESEGVVISEPYDDTLFDEGDVTGDPGSYDYSTGTAIQTNRFDTGQTITEPQRLLVTLDGDYLFEDVDYVVDGSIVEILGPVINAAQVVAITSFTQDTVPGAIAFRIFQDMRGQQTTYRITASTTTELTQELSQTGDTIYVADASKLAEPNLEQGLFGMITINGERITYRERDTTNNTLSGLRRGTAGTAAAPHFVGAAVYDIGVGNILPLQYQNTIVYNNTLANGTQTSFVADNIDTTNLDSTDLVEAVEVYVGGIKQTSGYTIAASSPVRVVFDTAPTAGYQVTILVNRGLSWYDPDTPGVPLQEQQTLAARFISGTFD